MSHNGYLRYAPSVEQIQPDEAETIKAVVASIERTSLASPGIRQQHAKAHGFLRGELTVHGDLPDHLRQGMFVAARSYPIIVRYSTAFGELRSDRIRRPRGMAIKVLGVSGPRALPEDGSTNQDLVLVNHKSYFSTAAAYLWLQRQFERQPGFPDFALKALGWASRGLVKLPKPNGIPFFMAANGLADPGNNILGETFWSQAALRFGDYVARLSAAPLSESLIRLNGQPCHDDDDALLKSVVEYFSKNSAEYELRAQLGTDLKHTPIEDASVDWPEDISPLQPLARITIPPQNADTPARRLYADDVLSFSPWRCLADHRPLGSLMRLRKEAYRTSSVNRHAYENKLMVEPRDISEFPD
jgi:hypothetical protein